MLICGIILNFLFEVVEWDRAFVGMIVAAAILFLIREIGQLLFKKESMGMGDVKLAGVIGFYIGWELFLVALFSGSLVALLITLTLRLIKNQPLTTRIPFAPYLSASCLIALLWGDRLWGWYVNLI